MLFVITIGEQSGFVGAADIGQAERYVREWLGHISAAGEVRAVPDQGGIGLRVADAHLSIRPLPPLADLRTLSGAPVPLHIGRPKERSQPARYDDFFETL